MLDSTAKCWGYGRWSQLGNGWFVSYPVPVDVKGLLNITAVSANGGHSCALLTSGKVKCWGNNSNGQLGDGTTTTIARIAASPLSMPDVEGLSDVVQVSAGGLHTCALLKSGSVKCWGYNATGQLGDGTSGTDRRTPVDVVGLTGVTQISASGGHACAVLINGTAKCWGWNGFGQLGDGTSGTSKLTPVDVVGLTGVTQISAGTNSSCAALANGTAKCWGDNAMGQLGDGTSGTNRLTPIEVIGLTSVTQIDVGNQYSCAVNASRTTKCWGLNNSGQLGDGTTTARFSPVEVQVR